MKKKIFSLVFLLLVIYLPAGVFSQSGSLVQNFTAKWINKVPWLSYTNSAQAEFKTYIDTCTQLGCYIRILEQKDVPGVDNGAFFYWIADPQEILPVPDSVEITSKWISKDPQNLPLVFLQAELLQKTKGGGYFSEHKDIDSAWNTYTWKINYQEAGTFEGFAIGVIIGQSTGPMKAVVAIKTIKLWRNGVCYYQYSFSGTTAVAVENNPTVPTTFTLFQNYPNPFNPTTTIKYQVASREHIRLTVYDLLGREVAILVDEEKSTGTYEAKFNASTLASGTYIYRLQAGKQMFTRKMLLLK